MTNRAPARVIIAFEDIQSLEDIQHTEADPDLIKERLTARDHYAKTEVR